MNDDLLFYKNEEPKQTIINIYQGNNMQVNPFRNNIKLIHMEELGIYNIVQISTSPVKIDGELFFLCEVDRKENR